MATTEDKNVETVKLRRRPEMVTAQELIDYLRSQESHASYKLASDIDLLLREFVER